MIYHPPHTIPNHCVPLVFTLRKQLMLDFFGENLLNAELHGYHKSPCVHRSEWTFVNIFEYFFIFRLKQNTVWRRLTSLILPAGSCSSPWISWQPQLNFTTYPSCLMFMLSHTCIWTIYSGVLWVWFFYLHGWYHTIGTILQLFFP